ncbi:MAG TPA: hypothetical protein PKH77_04535 [Anaerolineae bacterium]|nr:hypothetical protein [Anaerolineae bacterium]
MTESAVIPERKMSAARHARWADLAVIAVVVVALLAGVWVRSATLHRTEGFAFDNLGISGRAPAGWARQFGDDPLLRLRDLRSGTFATTLEMRRRPLAAEADVALALDALVLERAANATAYTSLRTEQVAVHDAVATQRGFTYVAVNRNPYVDQLPVVVRGVDVALRVADQVYVITYMANADEFDASYAYFRAFIEDLEF